MRLIKLEEDGQFSFKEFIGEEVPAYGILSHTWGAHTDEVTLKDLVEYTAKRKKVGYEKLRFCAERAAADHLQWFWIDTCSIDKTSRAELSEAINSMYRWYYTSTKCYVYLSDVSFPDVEPTAQLGTNEQVWEPSFRKSRWWTRGWTLQELLAPKSVEFFSKEGMLLGDKRALGPLIHEITGIAQRALQTTQLYEFSVDERMSWAEARKTTREEDMAYSLLGLFDVNMPLLYGEGQRKALTRLYREIKDSLPSDQPTPFHDQLQALGLEKPITSNQNTDQKISPPTYTPCMALDNSPIVAACPSQKEITVLVHGNDSTLKYMTLESGIPTTPNWQSDGKWFCDTPAVFSTRKSRLEIIAPTPYGKALYQETQTGLLLKEHWESLGDTITSPLTGLSWAPTHLDIFGLGKDGQVLRKTLTHGSWLPSKDAWTDLGGSFSLPPLAVSTVPGHLHILCVKDYNSYLHHKWWNGSSWIPSEKTWATGTIRGMSPPTAVATDRNRLDIFIRTSDELLHGIYQEGVWFEHTKWVSIGQPDDGAWISRPAAALSRAGRIELFCLSSDNQLYHRRFLPRKNEWDPPEKWNPLGGDFNSAPAAITSRNGKVHVFCKGYDEEIYHMDLDEEEWKSLGSAD